MCMLCDADPINAIDGTHDKLADYLAKASTFEDVTETLVYEGEIGDISVGGTVSASFGDNDVYSLNLSEGETVTIDLAGFGTDTVVSLYDVDGNLLGTNDDIARGTNTDSSLVFTAEDAGSFYVKVDSFNGAESNGSGYELTVETANANGWATLDTLADQLHTGYWSTPRKWNLSDTGYLAKDGTLTYNITGNEEDGNGLTSARQEMVREAYKLYEVMLGIDFEEVTSNGSDFRWSDNKSGAYAGSAYGVVDGQGYNSYSIVNVENNWFGGSSEYNAYTFQTILHEIGHALGLGHQGDYNGSASYGRDAKYSNDSWQGSMMSYFSQNDNTTVDASYAFLLSPMAADWIALDEMYAEYGFSTANAFTGDTVWGFNTTITASVSKPWSDLATHAEYMAFTIVDGGGIDTVDFSGFAYDQRIDLTITEGSFTQATTSDIGSETGNMTLAEGTVIENAVGGSGNDVIIGNTANNTLDGGAGDDQLTGGAGNDDLKGGEGTDTVVFSGNYADYSFLTGDDHLQVTGEGVDKVFDSVENLAFQDQTVAYGDISGDPVPTPDPASDPDAKDDTLTLTEDATLSADLFADNGSGADAHSLGLSFTVTSVDGAAPGTVTLSNGASYSVASDGTVSFATNGAYDALGAGASASVSFGYTITSTDGRTDTATATIMIQGVNDGPVAVDDSFAVSEGDMLSGNVLFDNGVGRDSDIDTGDSLSVTAINGQSSTTVMLSSGARVGIGTDGTFAFFQNGAYDGLYTGESAVETIAYTISDGNGGSDTGMLSVTVNGVGDDPSTGTGTGTGSGTGMVGTEANDNMVGSSDGEVIEGRGGRDRIDGGEGDDEIDGGTGRDRIDGGSGDDEIYGGDGSDRMEGGLGSDTLDGGAERDIMMGGEGDDYLTGGAGTDRLRGDEGNDLLFGGEDSDGLKGGTGDDELYGGLGDDNLRGDEGSDLLLGEDGNDKLNGADGNDSLFGGNGDDRLNGGNGDDVMVGGDGADRFNGGTGFDTVTYASESSAVIVSMDRRGEVGGAAEGDSFRGVEAVIGTAYNDTLGGNRFDNVLTGGDGSDSFTFDSGRSGSDRITDFQNGSDKLDFTALGLGIDDFTITQVGEDAVLSTTAVRDLTVTLENFSINDVDSLDFA